MNCFSRHTSAPVDSISGVSTGKRCLQMKHGAFYADMFCLFLLLVLTILDTGGRYKLFLLVLVSLLVCSRSLPPNKCFLGKNECTSFANFSLYLPIMQKNVSKKQNF